MQLWTEYFHNGNPIYAVNNRMAAIAAANRLPVESGLRILEVGAGAGSAAEALLDELRHRGRLGEIADYRLTEPNPMLRRRAIRTLAARYPGLALTDQAYDIDLAPAGQGLSEAGFHLVFAVNVLHIAQDLRASLDWLRSLLVPGGWLIGGECQRLFPQQTIPIELIFEQLSSFTQVKLDREVRSSHGFLTPEQWRGSTRRHRFHRASPRCPTWREFATTTRDSFPVHCVRADLSRTTQARHKEPECPASPSNTAWFETTAREPPVWRLRSKRSTACNRR